MTHTFINEPTLLINKCWTPIDVISVRDALSKAYTDDARIVDINDYSSYSWSEWSKITPKNDEKYLKCVNFSIKIPNIIVLTNYADRPPLQVPCSRRNIFRRDDNTCQYCGSKPGLENLTIEHIIPRSRGGITSWENCVIACYPCNRAKADISLEASGFKLLKKPIKPKWNMLFEPEVVKVESWRKFLSEVYWNVSLEE
jgi:5-methylcytosine-specific restriction endonuclease McrA